MIFPYKQVGHSCGTPCGDRVYFLTRYIIRETVKGPEIIEVEPGEGEGLMRPVRSSRVIARPEEVTLYPGKVELADRTRLIELASLSETRCTIFQGHDEHLLFICDPDPSVIQTVHVYDVMPPRPSLSAAIGEIERIGLFGELGIRFEYHMEDISSVPADVYPCRAAGFEKSLDSDPMQGGERVACCMTGATLYRELWGGDFTQVEICPLRRVDREPFIARCCRKEREGIGTWHGMFGAIVHWGSSPEEIRKAVVDLADAWRERVGAENRGS